MLRFIFLRLFSQSLLFLHVEESEHNMKLFVFLVIFSVAFTAIFAELQDDYDEFQGDFDETDDEKQLDTFYQQFIKRGLSQMQDNEIEAAVIDKRGRKYGCE